MNKVFETLSANLERLVAMTVALESSAMRMEQYGDAQRGEVAKITAAVEVNLEISRREMELERRLVEAEGRLTALQAQVERAEPKAATRKTLPAATVQLLAKQGIDAGDTMDVQSLDAALAGFSVEQRIAVKSQMLRTGTLTR